MQRKYSNSIFLFQDDDLYELIISEIWFKKFKILMWINRECGMRYMLDLNWCQSFFQLATFLMKLFARRFNINCAIPLHKVFRKFYPIQTMHPKFRNFLIGKGKFLFFLVWRLFHQDKENNLRRIPNSLVAKLMMTIGFLPEMKRSSHDFKRFLSIV